MSAKYPTIVNYHRYPRFIEFCWVVIPVCFTYIVTPSEWCLKCHKYRFWICIDLVVLRVKHRLHDCFSTPVNNAFRCKDEVVASLLDYTVERLSHCGSMWGWMNLPTVQPLFHRPLWLCMPMLYCGYWNILSQYKVGFSGLVLVVQTSCLVVCTWNLQLLHAFQLKSTVAVPIN